VGFRDPCAWPRFLFCRIETERADVVDSGGCHSGSSLGRAHGEPFESCTLAYHVNGAFLLLQNDFCWEQHLKCVTPHPLLHRCHQRPDRGTQELQSCHPHPHQLRAAAFTSQHPCATARFSLLGGGGLIRLGPLLFLVWIVRVLLLLLLLLLLVIWRLQGKRIGRIRLCILRGLRGKAVLDSPA
jgi:hypothetical protein